MQAYTTCLGVCVMVSMFSLGLLKSVDKSVALMQDAWTYRPDLNIYWITEDI
jgi:hypothetical protein